MSTSRTIRLGVFVILGTIFFLVALYFIGSKRNMFGNTFRVKAGFYNIDGLMPGNSVRLMGINIGTVEHINILNDTTVEVTMLIKESSRQHIKKDAEASIGTEGLMGSRLVNIVGTKGTSHEVVENYDLLQSLRPISTDEILRTLDYTSRNTATMSFELAQLVQSISHGPGSITALIKDKDLADNIKETIKNLEVTSGKTITLAQDVNELVSHVRLGKGALGALVSDTSNHRMLTEAFSEINTVSTELHKSSRDLQNLMNKLKGTEGSVPLLLNDTAVATDLREVIISTHKGAENFNQTLEALQHSIFLRGYFKKKAKEEQKAKVK